MTAQGAVFVFLLAGLRNNKVGDLKRCFHSAFNYHLFLVNFVYPSCLELSRGNGDELLKHQKIIGNDDKYSCPFSRLFYISFILNFRISFSSSSS